MGEALKNEWDVNRQENGKWNPDGRTVIKKQINLKISLMCAEQCACEPD